MPVQSSPLFSAPLTIISLALSLREAKAALPTVVGKSSLICDFGFGGWAGRIFFLLVGEGRPERTIVGICCCPRCTGEARRRPCSKVLAETRPPTVEGTTKASHGCSSTSAASGDRKIIVGVFKLEVRSEATTLENAAPESEK